MTETLFISDLHLSLERPEKLALFKRLLEGRARQAKALYILGDLVEQFWAGNDDGTLPNPDIIEALRQYTQAGGTLFMIRGNRELVLDKGIENITGCTLLEDGSTIDLYGERVLLMHGDVLCTQDVKYQRYRRFMEHPFIKGLYLLFPYRLRILLSHGLRPFMKKSKEKKPMTIIDVEQDAVEATMRRHHTHTLIHGHTHRPDTHHFDLDGSPARRIVLGDWYVEDSVLVCDEEGEKLMRAEDYLSSS